MLGVQLPPGPLVYALADQPGVVATPSPWRAWVQIPSRVLTRRVGRAPASPSGCNPPAFAVQVQLLPDTLIGLVAQPAEQDSLKVEVQGSTPCGATGRSMGVSSNGKTVGLHPADEGSTPSTVHCEWPGGGMADTRSSEGRAHRGVRVQVPPWSLPDATLSCGFKHRPSEGWLASSTLAWGTVGCLADFERWVYEARLAGSTPARPTGSVRRQPGTGDTDIERLQPGERRPL